MKLLVHAIPHQSALWAASFPPGEAKGILRIRPTLNKTISAYRKTPQSALTGCQLPFQGRFSRCPLWGWCSAQRIEIAMIAGGNHTLVSCRDSGKGGAVGDFELLPFNEPHPLCDSLRAA